MFVMEEKLNTITAVNSKKKPPHVCEGFFVEAINLKAERHRLLRDL